VRSLIPTKSFFNLTSSYHASANIQSQQAQQTHNNVQRASTRIAQTVATRAQEAANQVFAINELLEQILLHVGTLDDLVRMRGVNRQWKDVIEDTKSLKGIIFLSPQESNFLWRSMVKIGPGSPRYKLIREAKSSVEPEEGQHYMLEQARINPLLFHQLSEYANMPVWNTGSCNRWTSEELHLRKGARLQGTKLKVSSPVLNMFATQPPVNQMTFRTGGASARQIRNSKGIKVIDVLRVAEGLVGGLDGRVVVDCVLFPPEDVDEIHRKDHLDLFYAWN